MEIKQQCSSSSQTAQRKAWATRAHKSPSTPGSPALSSQLVGGISAGFVCDFTLPSLERGKGLSAEEEDFSGPGCVLSTVSSGALGCPADSAGTECCSV